MYHKQLDTYITSKLKQGCTFESIKSELLVHGWSIEDINEAYKYSMQSGNLNRFSISRFFHSEVPMYTNILLIAVIIIIFAGCFLYFRNPIYNYTVNLATVAPETKSEAFTYGEQQALSDPIFFEKVKNQFISQKVNFVSVNLSTMSVEVYKNGNDILQIPIKTIGREGSWWETPAGLYKINTKELITFQEWDMYICHGV